ncbi:MAG: M16 family metallopeptidase [bacterium]
MNTNLPRDWSEILNQVEEHRLENGLKVLFLPKPGVGSVVCDIYYAGGSATDPPGRQGLTHFLEHMLYDGTALMKPGVIDSVMLRAAGHHNAETGSDFSHFWCQLPTRGQELALMLEADRMRNAVLSHGFTEVERGIILEEEARYREQPFDELMNRINATIFAGHPYQNSVIGTRETIIAIRRDDLKAHYSRIFQPSNAVLVLVGDIKQGPRYLNYVEKFFGEIPSTCSDRAGSLLETPTTSNFDGRRLLLETEEIVPRGVMLWPAPDPFDMRSRAWGTAASILGVGRSSRLWQKLVEETDIAATIGVSLSDERRGGYLAIEMELNPGSSFEEAESAVQEVIEQLNHEGPGDVEFQRIKKQRTASARWHRQLSVSLAGMLGTWDICDDWRNLAKAWQLDELVDKAAVAEVFKTLKPERRVSGWTVPCVGRAARPAQAETTPSRADQPFKNWSDLEIPREIEDLAAAARVRSPFRIAGRVPEQTDLTNGIAVIRERLAGQGIMAVDMRWRTGWMEEHLPGVAYMTARMCEEMPMPEGSLVMSEYLENLGVSMNSSASGFSFQGCGEELSQVVDCMIHLLNCDKFDEEQFGRILRRTATELEADLDDPSFRAENLLRGMVYGEGPGSHDPRGTLQSLKKIKLEDIRRHKRNYYIPPNLIIGMAADQPNADILARLKKIGRRKHWLGDSSIRINAEINQPKEVKAPLVSRVLTMRSPGLQTHLVMGHLTLPRTHPDWIALQVLEVLVGNGPGNADILTKRLREDLGMVYSVSTSLSEGAWRWPGYLRIALSCDPKDIEFVEAETLRILAAVSQGEIDGHACIDARDYYVRTWQYGMEAADDRLASWLDLELYEWLFSRPPAWIQQCADLTVDQVRQAARRWVRPDRLQFVRFGPNE